MEDEIENNSLWGSGDASAPDVQERMAKFKVSLLWYIMMLQGKNVKLSRGKVEIRTNYYQNGEMMMKSYLVTKQK